MATSILEPFVRQWAVLLVTSKRDGTPVGTPVSIAVEGRRAFVRTWDTAWKFRRIRSNPEVEVAPCTALAHRLMGYRTVHVELTPVPGNNSGAGESALRPVTSSARSSGSRRPAG